MHCVWLKREVCSRLGPEKGNSLYRTNGINLTVNTGCFINTGPLSRISTAVVSMIVNIQQEATSIGQFQYNYQPHAALIHRVLAHIITDISTHRLHWYLFNTTIFVSRIYQQRIKYMFVSFILDGKDQFYFEKYISFSFSSFILHIKLLVLSSIQRLWCWESKYFENDSEYWAPAANIGFMICI